jgi:hypothetical protein
LSTSPENRNSAPAGACLFAADNVEANSHDRVRAPPLDEVALHGLLEKALRDIDVVVHEPQQPSNVLRDPPPVRKRNLAGVLGKARVTGSAAERGDARVWDKLPNDGRLPAGVLAELNLRHDGALLEHVSAVGTHGFPASAICVNVG